MESLKTFLINFRDYLNIYFADYSQITDGTSDSIPLQLCRSVNTSVPLTNIN